MSLKEYTDISLTKRPNDKLLREFVAKILEHREAELLKEIVGIDQKYVDFLIKCCEITLHQDHYLGISIYPTKRNDATPVENELITSIASQLMNR